MDDRRIGNGEIGGKGSGFLQAKEVLRSVGSDLDRIVFPRTCFLTTEAFVSFRKLNKLEKWIHSCTIADDEFYESQIKRDFLRSTFPQEFADPLRDILKKVEYPLAIRSSSKLEDRKGTSFAGKYETVFISNRGTLDERLDQIITAIKEVYASTYCPNAVDYRCKHNMSDSDEQMAIMIQEAIGREYEGYFLPLLAGVGFSMNDYAWNKEIKKEDGLIRLVFGLGTRAVGRGYARLFSPGKPSSRPEGNITREIIRFSQTTVDALDMKKNKLVSIEYSEIVKNAMDCYPGAEKLFSLSDGHYLYLPVTNLWNPEHTPVLTFDTVLKQKMWGLDLARLMKRAFDCLSGKFGCPVDVEFAIKRNEDGEAFLYILQCRPLSQRGVMAPQVIPWDVPGDRQLFSVLKNVPSGKVDDIEYIVYVDPDIYHRWPLARRHDIARTVGRVNRALRNKKFILMGPGRWGSANAELGVPVRYSEVSNCAMLVEIARQRGEFVPEVSYGTHFFQDLIEDRIVYIPLYPDDEGTVFNEGFFKSENSLVALLRDEHYAAFEDVIRVLHVPALTGGCCARAAMNGEAEEALVYIDEG